MFESWGLWGLFASGFLSATLLPGSSEAMLLLAAHQAWAPKSVLWLVATLGNTFGGLSNWLLGYWLSRRLPIAVFRSAPQRRAIERVRRWGSPILLFSWVPIVGDPLCVAAGWLRVPLFATTVLVVLGKGARYVVLLQLLD